MKKFLALVMAFMISLTITLTVFADEAAVQSSVPVTVSTAYAVMNAETGQVLVQKNLDEKRYPASITKILTAAIALEVGDPKDKYVITKDDVFSYTFPGTTYVALTHDEVVTVEQLLYGTLMVSANDAANCLGSYVAKKLGRTALNANGEESYVQGFVEIINEKLEELGCTNTHFTNAHGLHNEEHYTTARDMAIITQYALGVEGFRDYFGALTYTMEPTNMQPQQRFWRSQTGIFNKNGQYYYEGATGAKLGYTDDASHTMVTVAERDGIELISVVLDCKQGNDVDHKDSKLLLDYCFNNFENVTFTKSELKQKSVPIYREGVIYDKVTVTASGDYKLQLHKLLSKADITFASNIPGRFLYGDELKGSLKFSLTKSAQKEIGDAMYTELGVMPLVLKEAPVEVEKKSVSLTEIFDKIKIILKPIGIVFGALVLVILVLRAYNKRRYRKIMEQRKKREAQRQKNYTNSNRR